MADIANSRREEGRMFRKEFTASRPPKVQFASDLKAEFGSEVGPLEHIEFMMSLMEAHPFIPFDITFGSDVLDFRRALAYEITLRQLAHTRSLVANTNIRNRPGVGSALRCMLEMYAFSEYILTEKVIGDRKLLEKLYHGRAFTPGGWYDIEKEWEKEHTGPIPEETRDFFKSFLNLPRVGNITKPLFDADKGASYIYSVYSEFIHPAFGRPREDVEEELGNNEPFEFGSHEYYTTLQSGSTPIGLLKRDVSAGSFCLELFWPRVLDIDPFLDDKCRTQVVAKLKEQGVADPRGED
jgi:hypothetical protein